MIIVQHTLPSSSLRAQGCARVYLPCPRRLLHWEYSSCRHGIHPPARSCVARASSDSSSAEVVPAPAGDVDAQKPEVDERERLRRERISAANAGKEPWNKGRKHSPETIAKIRERTRQAMLRDDVSDKLKEARAKQMSKPLEQDVRARIRERLLAYHAAKRQEKANAAAADPDAAAAAEAKPKRRRSSSNPKKAGDAGAAEDGASIAADGGEVLLGKVSPSKPLRKADDDAAASTVAPLVLPKPRRKAAPAPPAGAVSNASASSGGGGSDGASAGAVAGGGHGGAAAVPSPSRIAPRPVAKRSPEHRAAIAEAIRRKWQDPEYRASAVAGIRKAVGSGPAAPGAGGGRGGASKRRAPTNRATMPTGSGTAGMSQAEAGGSAAAPDDDPLLVRSSRTGRAGGRPGVGSPVDNVGGASSSGEPGGSGGGGRGNGNASQIPPTAVQGGGISPAARLHHVGRLVQQVLTAERLVANTEHLLRQFTQRRHALRNDPVIRYQADEQLRNVTATLQQAKAKLELLRSRVPPDARYNDKGDVWFVAGVQGARPSRAPPGDGAAGAGPGARSGVSGGGGSGEWASWSGNGNGNGLGDAAAVLDADGRVVDFAAGPSSNGASAGGHPRAPDSSTAANNTSSRHNDAGSSNGLNGRRYTNGNLASFAAEDSGGQQDAYGRTGSHAEEVEEYGASLDEAKDDEDGEDAGEGEGDGDDDGPWPGSRWGHSPPNGQPSGPSGGGAFADQLTSLLPQPSPEDLVRVDLSSLDPLNTLGLRPVNGHAARNGAPTRRGGSSTSPGSLGTTTRGGASSGDTDAASAASQRENRAGGGGAADGGFSDDSASPAAGGGTGLAPGAGGSDGGVWLVDGGRERPEGGGDLAVWLGSDQVRTVGELRALLPASHSWLVQLLEQQEQGSEAPVGLALMGTAHAHGRGRAAAAASASAVAAHDAASQDFDWLRLLRERVSAGGGPAHAGSEMAQAPTGARTSSDTALGAAPGAEPAAQVGEDLTSGDGLSSTGAGAAAVGGSILAGSAVSREGAADARGGSAAPGSQQQQQRGRRRLRQPGGFGEARSE